MDAPKSATETAELGLTLTSRVPKIVDVTAGKFGETPGQRLRQDRLAAGLEVRTLADLLELSRSHVRNLENGHRSITRNVAVTAAAALGTDPDRYQGGDPWPLVS